MNCACDCLCGRDRATEGPFCWPCWASRRKLGRSGHLDERSRIKAATGISARLRFHAEVARTLGSNPSLEGLIDDLEEAARELDYLEAIAPLRNKPGGGAPDV